MKNVSQRLFTCHFNRPASFFSPQLLPFFFTLLLHDHPLSFPLFSLLSPIPFSPCYSLAYRLPRSLLDHKDIAPRPTERAGEGRVFMSHNSRLPLRGPELRYTTPLHLYKWLIVQIVTWKQMKSKMILLFGLPKFLTFNEKKK